MPTFNQRKVICDTGSRRFGSVLPSVAEPAPEATALENLLWQVQGPARER